ncbi:MAG TPA: Rpn family recombination-promoting nuclease/putative transposase [Thermoanaerobaculia bacterium]|nr:Rpn family recombination-promoting nuclease/putative transposase [Thermoanaerobaculia bacterium]
MADHDNGYKLLFSHAETVADFLRGFVKEDWVGEIDLSTLERVDGSYVSDDLRSREGDVVWRVSWRGSPLYVYLLLEFQSTVDQYMAVRVMTYLGLLYQDLIRQKALPPSGLLPPVFLAVLYNGDRPWKAPLEVTDLIGPVPGGLEGYRPQLRYVLFDELRLPDLGRKDNLVAVLFGLERARAAADFARKVEELSELLRASPDVSRSYKTWLTRVLLPSRFPGARFPEIQDLQEIQTMGLAERVMEWTREWKEEGLQEGLQKGHEEGLESLQEVVLSLLEQRFGTAVSEDTRGRVLALRDLDELKRMAKGVLRAGSLRDLGLDG